LYLRKKIKPVNQYQVWVQSGTSVVLSGFMDEGFLNDDILGIWESLGNRCANEIFIDNPGSGTAIVRFNVSKKLYRPYNEFHNNFVGRGQGLATTSSVLVAEIEELRPDLQIEGNTSISIGKKELSIYDLKVVNTSSGLRIIVT
jgi:hypothetical protein